MQLHPAALVLGVASFCHAITAETVQRPLTSSSGDGAVPHRVAIIGAGAGGASAAYYISDFTKSSNLNMAVNITVFETNNRIGGRTTTINALNDPRYPTELGASIFVEINQILYNHSRDFGLELKQKRNDQSTGSKFDLGIWNGDSFVFTVANDENSGGRWQDWWNIAKLLWKYGLSPIRTQRLARDAVGRFLKLYDEYFPFSDLSAAVEKVELVKFTGLSGAALLESSGISEQFGREIVQSSTRVNYAQNLDTIHGLETMVCMSIEGATAVEGGNWQIFDHMVRRSGAQVNFNSTVTKVETNSNGKPQLTIEKASQLSSEDFDTVILATPFHGANVRFQPALLKEPEKVDYVSLYVLLFTSPFRPSPRYFGVESEDQVPNAILTTLPEGMNMENKRGQDAVGPTKFWSLSTLRILDPSTDGFVGAQVLEGHIDPEISQLGRQYLYKIFSPKPVSAASLSDMFGWSGSYSTENGIESLPTDLVTWYYEKKWHSYPYLSPRTDFGSFRLWQGDDKDSSVPAQRGNIWYTSAIEPFISTMETSALSGMNVARLIVDELDENTRTKAYVGTGKEGISNSKI